MNKCDLCSKEIKVIIKLELFNSEIDEEPILKNICWICLDKKKYNIDIREFFQLEYEDLIDFPKEYYKEE